MSAPSQLESKLSKGHLNFIDSLNHGDDKVGSALALYTNSINDNKQSRHWVRSVRWMENILFGLGRQYIEDFLGSGISKDAAGNLSIQSEITRDVPQPTNDLLGRYIETNIALLTENRPIPRVTAKSDSNQDKKAAELSELTMEFLWEQLDLPEKHREMARILLYTGMCMLEVGYDPLVPRYMISPETESEDATAIPGPEGAPPIRIPTNRYIPQLDETGAIKFNTKDIEYGDITANIVTPFEMHIPTNHWWNGEDMGWIMREYYTPIDHLRNKYSNPKIRHIVTKKNGWFLENLDKVKATNVQTLPVWWWEQLTDTVEGPAGSALHTGTTNQWDDYTVVRIFDRKPNAIWPRGRTIIVAGESVIYDSPKKVGARAFDPRWPNRWHPYIRYRWEGQIGTIYGRSLVSKLLPKLKRINSIDTTQIMWRRTVPIATWLMPKGSSPVENIHTGKPGAYIEFDPRRTQQHKPEPVYPPSFPEAALRERDTQISEMEAIAGTEQVLRGERPVGVNSAAMLDALRKQALASRSAILQAWDESLQVTGGALLQEVIKNVGKDERYKQGLNLLAREKASQFTVDSFAGTVLTDNVQVRIDTASMAMLAKEAKQTRAIEVIQFAPNLAQLPNAFAAKLVDELGWPDAMAPKGDDINRARAMISYIKSNRFDLAIPMPEDDPYVLHEMMVSEMKSDAFMDLPEEQQMAIIKLIEIYRDQIERIEQARIQMQMMMGQAQAGGGPEGG